MTPYIRIAVAILVGASLFGCATTAENVKPKPAISAAADPSCLTATGSLIAETSKCRGIGRSYSSEDIKSTGATSAGDALAVLDPSITVHR
jgi:hypothetical protein